MFSPAKKRKYPECPAYQWWNSQLEDITDLNTPPEIVLPHVAHKIWSKICPIFLLFVIDEQEARNYWDSIQTIVTMFSEDQEIPNPLSHFPEFLQAAFSLQYVLTPQTVDQCIFFINKFGYNDASHFFLYQSPVFFLDPLLYLGTLLELRRTQNYLWTDFVKSSTLVDAFFEMYNGFLLPVPLNAVQDVLKHRILLIEVLYSLIEDSFQIHTNILNISSKFLDNSINMISNSQNDLPVAVYRTIFNLFKLLENSMPKDQLSAKALAFFEGVSNVYNFTKTESSSLYLTFRFLFDRKLISPSNVMKTLSSRGIQSIVDFSILSDILDGVTVIPMIIFLVKASLQSHLWHRSCFSLIKICLVKFSLSRPDIKELMNLLIRRLFLWISFASMRRKYHTRSLLLCESLIKLLESHLIWLQQTILSQAASIMSKPTPSYFKSFFYSSAPVDDVTLHEWDSFVSNVKLKTFPFDPVKGNLIMPPKASSTARLENQRINVKIVQRQENVRKTKTSIIKASKSTTSKKKIIGKVKKSSTTTGSSIVIKKPKSLNLNRPTTAQSDFRVFPKRKDAYF
ncbi:hypothetical protein TRFO_40945 [Tritrichomonas foetus]|uniref:Uncharacterized protein n=1 Tax=Tritrichomonas foetus TaxID=1144522 RepID=A0A1J4IZ83_9EUKA|nr:hypothetical protein TRFO_40945 [Tritrichomonas foetus]|eukprot:OHS92726.1 hypothetical protein TRFO_40945 [Tritrichomonas foetus]